MEQLEEDVQENVEASDTLHDEQMSESTDETVEDPSTSEEQQGPGVVQKMVRKFSHRSLRTPFLARRNTVTRCTNVVNDIKQEKHNLVRRSSQGQHVIWDDSVTSADAATDNEFSSLMDRIHNLNQCVKDKDSDLVDGPPLARDSPSRKSLPSGALKSYMRGTKASVMKTRDSNVSPQNLEGDKGPSDRQSTLTGSPSVSRRSNSMNPSLEASPQPKALVSSRAKNRHSHTEGNETVRRRKMVVVKPSIPPVLLKSTNNPSNVTSPTTTGTLSQKNVSHESTAEAVVGGIQKPTNLNASDNTDSDSSDRAGVAAVAQHHLLSGQCEESCNHCLLVDLWFTIWHVEFNKK